MARPLTITPTLIASVVARRQRGESFRTIGTALDVPEATCRRAARAYETAGKPERPLKKQPDPPAGDIPEGADPAQVTAMMAEVKKAADAAKASNNLTAYASLMTRLVALMEHQRKIAPPPKSDPNDVPDFAAARERVRADLHRLIDHPLIFQVDV